MYFALVHFPNIDTTQIELIRDKYDPSAHMVAAHITVLFPVPDEIGENALIKHIDSVLKQWEPFPICINGLYKSWDNWLFLILKDGNAEVIRLQTQIYTGILKPYYRKDLDYVPHIGLGLFVKEGHRYDFKNPQYLEFDEQKYVVAVREVSQLGLDFRCVLDKLHLVTLANDFTNIKANREFLLGGESLNLDSF
jgi:2'-5' RNA ligase